MTRSSEEGKKGLGWINADTKRFRLERKFKVPHRDGIMSRLIHQQN